MKKQQQQQEEVEYRTYSSNFSKEYLNSLNAMVSELKSFCIQMATAYAIVHLEDYEECVPRIKAVVYSPFSDTYYIHTNDINFLKYLKPNVSKFFRNTNFGIENFTSIIDFVDDDNFVLEVIINDKSTILNNSFFKTTHITI